MELVYPGQLPKIPSLIHYSLQRRIQGRPPPPPHFWTKLRPEGPKKRPPPTPLSQGLDNRGPPYL